MKPCLVDVNVWLALLIRHHVHHELAARWFEGLDAGQAGLCRLVQLSVVRLLGSKSIMDGSEVPASEGWKATEQLLADERVWFFPDSSAIELIMPTLLNYDVPTPKLVTDAYLAALAIADSRPLATLDREFLKFDGLRVQLLN